MNSELKPIIRFKGFTDDWEQRKLGSIGYTFTGLSGKTKDDFGHGKARFVTYMNVFSNPIATMDKTEAVEIDHKQNEVQYGDIFFTTSSETPEEVGMSSVWLENTANIYLNSFCFGFRPIELNNPYYMAYMLRAKYFRSKMILLAQGISRYNISKNSAMDIEIKLPKRKEQESIGELFYKIDNLITLHQRKCDKLTELKKSLLKKMFPQNNSVIPEIRFKGFTDDWEQRKLNNVCNISTGYPFDSQNFNNYGEFLVLTNGNVKAEFDEVDYKIGNHINVLDDSLKKYILKENEILVTMDGTVGRTAKTNKNKAILAQRVGRINNSEDQNFTYYLLNTGDFFETMSLLSHGGNIKHISLSEIGNYDILLPTNREQVLIGSCLNKLDNLITLHQRKHDKLNKIKQSLLNDMFV